MLTNTVQGLRSVDQQLHDLMTLSGASWWQRLIYLELPAALPAMLTGAKISGGLALIGAVVAEFVAGSGTSSSPLPGAPSGVVEAEVCLGAFEDGECTECGPEYFSEGFEPEQGCEQDPLQAILDGLFGPRTVPPETEDEPPKRRRRLWPF